VGLVGTGADADLLRRRVDAMRPRGLLWVDRFLSDTTDIGRYLSAADIFAFPSRDEGFPVAPIEAMSSGLAVVAAGAPGVADIFEGGEASGGLLVPVDDVSTFADGLGRLMDDREWCQELGQRARRRAQEYFSLESIGPRLAGLLTRRCA